MVVVAAILALVLMAGCGAPDPEKAEFKGTWKHTEENGITGAKADETVIATVKKTKFHQVIKSEYTEATHVYDGRTIYSKSVYTPTEAPSGYVSEPYENSKAADDDQTYNYRFWAKAITSGGGSAGGTIAGRETLFFKHVDRRPDGEASEQIWLDAKTGVLLKSILAIYSSQANTMVMQATWECQSIDFSPVADSVFVKP